ncbi:DNPEP [Branchiostoma lanceolatum]|uniref:aspartyl aminopeptidase n=1 Tax=Branchiostoma lanceolatum TaxID=7740 RepID=A0A8K0ABC1_BRALA|nr:DNPEP [Branchiostoma lanceolatum]
MAAPMAQATAAGTKEAILCAARKFVEFVNKCQSPFHVVEESRTILKAAGFSELREADQWDIKPNSKYFVTRNQSTVVAFAVGGKYKPGNGFTIVGAHTDSPCLKVKPQSNKVKSGYQCVGVECYGGGIWHTWFDRDLMVAGRVMVKNADKIEHRLVRINRPILRVPNIAIHLMRDHNDKFGPNKETNIVPVLATAVQAQLEGHTSPKEGEGPKCQADKHPPVLVRLLCEELGIQREDLLDFELCLADHQPAAIGGALEEFIFSPRLDNLVSSYCALQGLVESSGGNGSLTSDPNIRLIALYDNEEHAGVERMEWPSKSPDLDPIEHLWDQLRRAVRARVTERTTLADLGRLLLEEWDAIPQHRIARLVGSESAQGAASMLTEHILRRLSSGDRATCFEEAVPKSFLLSADQAHAVHPNYSEKHEDNHKPMLHKGIVIKFNANQRYATTAVSTSILREVGTLANVPLQDFVVRNDSPCGSTIGPILSAKLGMKTVDIGAPQLSMHSIREMGCTSSVHQSIALYRTYFQEYPSIYNRVNVD